MKESFPLIKQNHLQIQSVRQIQHFLLPCPLYNSIINKTINKLDENERNINTLLFGNDQLHLETNKKIFAIVHDFFARNRPLVNL